MIRREIHQGRVDFVTHPGDDGNPAVRNGPHEFRIVEGPEVLQAAATPHQQESLTAPVRILEFLDGQQGLRHAALALSCRRCHQDVDARRPSIHHLQDVSQRRAAQGRHHAQLLWEAGQGPLGAVEEALGAEVRFQLP